MRIYCLTLFPEMVMSGLNYSMLKRAMDRGVISVECVNIRDYARGRHAQADDAPYGGGAGMVMMAPPIYDAYAGIKDKAALGTRVIFMTPQGKVFNQKMADELSRESDLILLCGHYEGVDERVIEEIVTDEISLGDFVLTGGELAAMAVIDTVCRLVPGVVHNGESLSSESFNRHLLKYPQYTRPAEFMGRCVPEVLVSGHHKQIEEWRLAKSIERTKGTRPDLYALYERDLTKENR